MIKSLLIDLSVSSGLGKRPDPSSCGKGKPSAGIGDPAVDPPEYGGRVAVGRLALPGS